MWYHSKLFIRIRLSWKMLETLRNFLLTFK